MDRLASMAAFVKASESGSFAAAAAALDVSAQMVAKHVASLEARFGVRLINRTTRRQSLTDAGRTYYERCKAVLAEVEAVDALAHDFRAEPAGTLRINAPVTFGTCALVGMTTRFLEIHPQVEIDLVLDDRYVDPLEEGYDALFRIGPIPAGAYAATALKPFASILCAAPSYLDRRGTPETPDDLRGHECIGHAHWTAGATTRWLFAKEGRTIEIGFRDRLRINDSKGRLAAALDGFGIARLTEMQAAEALADGRLRRLLADHELPPRPLHLIYAAERRQSAKLRAFIAAAIQEFAA